MPKIKRMTLFKIPEPTNVEKVLQAYTRLEAEQMKDGKPYIISVQAYKLHDDPRSAGFTLAAETVFTNVEDMNYYDSECVAHDALKAVVKPVVAGPPLMIYMDSEKR